MILDNSITGMTGHQHNPATGFTIRATHPSSGSGKALPGGGVDRVRVCDPFDLEGMERIIREETAPRSPL